MTRWGTVNFMVTFEQVSNLTCLYAKNEQMGPGDELINIIWNFTCGFSDPKALFLSKKQKKV